VGRIVHTESGSTRRHRILTGVSQALRAAAQHPQVTDGEAREILAFLALSLTELQESVEDTVTAWERRDYWLKADRFRAEWTWVPEIRGRLEAALRRDDMAEARACGMELARVLSDRRLRPPRKAAERPWRGAWDAWLRKG